MRQYLDLMREIYAHGVDKENRNGKTRSLFARQLRFPLHEGFPAVTTKRLAFMPVVVELLWFLSGGSDNNELTRLGCKIWTANAEADYWKPKARFPGDLGRVYGVQWRHWRTERGGEIDQIHQVLAMLKENPSNRRMLVSAWNPGELDAMALPPCHLLFHLYVVDGALSLHMFQRSCDYFLGVPFNIASYALLTHILARLSGLRAHECILTLSDVHLYHDHFSAVEEQLRREPLPLPTLYLDPSVQSLDDLALERFQTTDAIKELIRLEGYESHPTIKAVMAV